MFLPPESNMIKFLNDFDIFESAEQDVFNYGFHIFGDMSGKAIDELDEKTALQRSYKSWLLNGNKYSMSEQGKANADVQGSANGINGNDVVAIQKYVLQLVDKLPI